MARNQYTQAQKAAIVSLVIEMVNIDNEVAFEELVVSNHVFYQLEITTEDYHLGKGLPYNYAVEIARKFSSEQQIELAKLLVEIIDADAKTDPRELRLLHRIATDISLTL